MTRYDNDLLEERAVALLGRLLADATKTPASQIRADAPFESLGLDSVLAMTVTDELEAVFGSLPKTLFFEFATVRELARHLAATGAPALLGLEAPSSVRSAAPPTRAGAVRAHGLRRKSPAPARWAQQEAPRVFDSTLANREGQERRGLDIAIIGLAGRYPGARTLDEFWDNLAAGRDCVTEIPAQRWDHRTYFDPIPGTPGKTYSKWGGFLDGADEFDPMFFGISPVEAELMDPQERLFLQCVYETLEDAGYTPARLNTVAHGDIGVYAGVMYSEYQLYGAQEQILGNPVAVSGNPSAVANRVSYCFDFHGPSMSVDTMCSSSLTALHLACQAIRSGACAAAVAGGVNLLIHPNKYLMLSQGRFVSSTGRCASFGEGGDGYVPAEGVGAVLLRPLEDAVRDNDRIHGVIRAIGTGHGGRTNGYAVPSPVAQSRTVIDAWRQASIDPRAVGYVEAHGTGTALGDPVEVAGLTRAFRECTADSQFCAIGSVKSNIGHAESAAGMSGLTKVLLQMRHRQLVPSLHSARLNPHLDLDGTPFIVQQSLTAWERPEITVDGVRRQLPLTAGVSSFGAGGSNVHLVVEEFRAAPHRTVTPTGPAVVVLSARDAERLRVKAGHLADWICDKRLTEDDLPSLAYTLQVGREAMRERTGLLASDVPTLLTHLRAIESGTEAADGRQRGRAGTDKDALARLAADADLTGALARRDGAALLSLWVQGVTVDWDQLYDAQAPLRIGLPSYPFVRDRYWLDTTRTRAARAAVGADEASCQVFSESWEPEQLVPGPAGSPRTIICLCADGTTIDPAAADPAATVILVEAGESFARTDENFYRASENDLVQVFTDIRERHSAVDGVLNLWSLGQPAGPGAYATTLRLLQAVAISALPVGRVLQAGEFGDGRARAYAESWLGFERSLGRVLPQTQFAAVLEDTRAAREATTPAGWLLRLFGELGADRLVSTLYRDGLRHVSRVRPAERATHQDRLRRGGTYLITGGAGGLGLLVAAHLASTRSAKLVLTGRSPLDDTKRRQLARLEQLGAQVQYEQADIADPQAMRAVVAAAREHFGALDGVIHAAGVAGGSSLLTHDTETFRKALSAKVDGTLVLDDVLAGEPLDFVCYFSSTSAVLGDFGGCDYAVANRFQSAYAEEQADRDDPAVQTVAVEWPLWRSGGLGFDDAQGAELYLSSSGMRLLEEDEGLALFERLIGEGAARRIVMSGAPERVRHLLGITSDPAQAVVAGTASAAPPHPSLAVEVDHEDSLAKGVEHVDLHRLVLTDLETLIGETLRVPRDQIHGDENLSQLGFDSVSLTKLALLLGRRLGMEVLPSVFFSYPTPEKLVAHLVAEQAEVLCRRYAEETPPAITSTATSVAGAVRSAEATTRTGAEPEPIAVIGMSGRFPGARTVQELWQTLEQGRDVLSPVPTDRRGDWSELDLAEQEQVRCGFVPGVAEFDPAFFEISPREARHMDPRQRLLLQEAWRALEDAGYGDDRLRAGVLGMFVGAEQGDYLHLSRGQGSITAQHEAIMASRLAYLLDFSGPVLSVNTACSSGLVAAHQACTSLRGGECETAVVAGVNLVTTARVYAETTKAGMLSPSGVCRAFDEQADGMVLGEAVAVVVLKRLSLAESDGDRILAVIRGSGMNYDGTTNGITAPSGAAQTRLYRSVYARYGIDPERIEHIVTHGTGTRLGDPVEVNALIEAFGERTTKSGFCALTSTKTNVGHSLAASGLVSLIALIQSLRHGVIPASLHCEHESDYIAWKDSPFYVNKMSRVWPQHGETPSLGAVSSFGMSGTNVHMVLEAYPEAESAVVVDTPQLLLLSAKTPQALEERLCELRDALASGRCDAGRLNDVAYTLLVGRQHFTYRCAVVVRDTGDVPVALAAAVAGESRTGISRGEVPRNGDRTLLNAQSRSLLDGLGAPASQRYNVLCMLADLYCRGALPDAAMLFAGDRPRLTELPGYPFARSRHWTTDDAPAAQPVLSAESITITTLVTDGELTASKTSETAGPRVTLSSPDTMAVEQAAVVDKPRHIKLTGLEGSPRQKNAVAAVTPAAALPSRKPLSVLREELRASLAEALYLPIEDISPGRDFVELGLDSIVGVEWIKVLNKTYGVQLAAARLYDHPSVRAFANFLDAELAAAEPAIAEQLVLVPERRSRPVRDGTGTARATVEEELRQSLAEALFIDPAEIGAQRNFVELGMDSIVGVEWIKSVNKAYGTSLTATRLYDYPTLKELAAYLETKMPGVAALVPQETNVQEPAESTPPAKGPRDGDCAVVVGMSGRYPQAENLRQYWDNLSAGRDCVREVPASRWDVDRYFDPRPGQKGKTYCKWMGYLEDADCFDPLFFNISPTEAEGLDPQQRIFLQEAYRAFEDAGYDPRSLSKKKCGVFLGVSGNEYSFLVFREGADVNAVTSGSNAIAAARIAYFLNLKGPAIALDTACSSSLVALHLAQQALIAHEIDLALVGGVSLFLLPDTFVGMAEAGMLSTSGRCRPFDDGADGFVPGEGVGALVLKRLNDAEDDHDHIYGIVRASGVNQDGKTNGITAPSVASQMELVRSIYERYGIDPASIGYVEMHGTGTKLGDPIELEALGTVYRDAGVPVGSCPIGSVKSNIGHTSAAAGVASVHKVLLGMRQGVLVPSLYFTTPNGHVDFERSPFRVNTGLRPWRPQDGYRRRRAAVSSFGFSGTNAHVVLEEYRHA